MGSKKKDKSTTKSLKAFCKKIIFGLVKSIYFSVYSGYLKVFIEDLRDEIWKTRLEYLGQETRIYPHVIIHFPENVRIGNRVAIAEFVHIWGGGGVEIGDFTIIAAHAVITSQTHDTDAPTYRESLINEPVKIGKNVWIGSGAIIMPGVTIGDNAVIGAGAVVTKDVLQNTVVAGVPARLLRYVKEAGNYGN